MVNKSTRVGARGRKRKITVPQASKPKLTLAQPQGSDVEEVEINIDPGDLSEAIDLNDGVNYIDGVPFADAADIGSKLDCSSSHESGGEHEETAGETNGQPKKQKKQFRWNSKKDLALVLEVQNFEPFLEEEIHLAALSTVKKQKTDEDGIEASGSTGRNVQKTLLEAYEKSKSEDRKSNEKIQDAALKDKMEDRDLEKLKIELEHKKLAVETKRLEMLKEKQDKEMDLARERFDLEKEERLNKLNTNQTLLNLLIAKKD